MSRYDGSDLPDVPDLPPERQSLSEVDMNEIMGVDGVDYNVNYSSQSQQQTIQQQQQLLDQYNRPQKPPTQSQLLAIQRQQQLFDQYRQKPPQQQNLLSVSQQPQKPQPVNLLDNDSDLQDEKIDLNAQPQLQQARGRKLTVLECDNLVLDGDIEGYEECLDVYDVGVKVACMKPGAFKDFKADIVTISGCRDDQVAKAVKPPSKLVQEQITKKEETLLKKKFEDNLPLSVEEEQFLEFCGYEKKGASRMTSELLKVLRKRVGKEAGYSGTYANFTRRLRLRLKNKDEAQFPELCFTPNVQPTQQFKITMKEGDTEPSKAKKALIIGIEYRTFHMHTEGDVIKIDKLTKVVGREKLQLALDRALKGAGISSTNAKGIRTAVLEKGLGKFQGHVTKVDPDMCSFSAYGSLTVNLNGDKTYLFPTLEGLDLSAPEGGNYLPKVHNDAHLFHKYLRTQGFEDEGIMLMLDDKHPDAKGELYPNGTNIKKAFQKLAQDAKDNDSIVVYYSGHGSSVKDHDDDEVDGKDECICPAIPQGESDDIADDDISDDWLKIYFVDKLKNKKCKVTIFVDACHSATMFDLPFMFNDQKAQSFPENPNHEEAGKQSEFSKKRAQQKKKGQFLQVVDTTQKPKEKKTIMKRLSGLIQNRSFDEGELGLINSEHVPPDNSAVEALHVMKSKLEIMSARLDKIEGKDSKKKEANALRLMCCKANNK